MAGPVCRFLFTLAVYVYYAYMHAYDVSVDVADQSLDVSKPNAFRDALTAPDD